MGKILLGVILILLGGTTSIRGHIIELTPNFIGSLLLLLALRELKIKDKSLIWSLWILIGIYLFNYIVAIVDPNGIPFELQPILVGGSLLWGIFIAVKIVEKARIDHGEDCKLNLNRIRKWFKILFVVLVVIGVGMISFTLTQGIINLISVWVFTIGAFVGIIPRYTLIYLFYKEFNSVKSKK
ncbi:MAG: hypothetical protein H9893_02915 [Candidatus Niameybacter stercoravium]|nr:hypothetical protein [Candidatus Niameybacter stercoravium]